MNAARHFIETGVNDLLKEVDAELFRWISGKKHPNLVFSGSLPLVYWGPHLDDIVTKITNRAFDEARAFAEKNGLDRWEAVKDAGAVAENVVYLTIDKMVDYDRGMRGKGLPNSVSKKDASREIKRSVDFISKRKAAELLVLDDSTEKRKHDYLVRVARSLAGCQLVELELKLYITQALELVKKRVAGCIPFHMDGKDYKDASLERLIEVFKKLSATPFLVRKLTTFKNERNFVAHKAIAACIDPEGHLQESVAAAIEIRLRRIESEAAKLTEGIQEESAKFIAHLYFDKADPTTSRLD